VGLNVGPINSMVDLKLDCMEMYKRCIGDVSV
jgi:hypothetical protein